MTTYTKIADYAAKDALLTGNPAKLIKGTELGAEFDAIAIADATSVKSGGALGTPSSGTLTNCTGLPVSTGVSGLGTGIATALAVNTGSAGAPVLFNGAGGTPTSLVGTNITGTAAGLTAGTASAVAVGGITGLGANVATALATPSTANMNAMLSDGDFATQAGSETLTNKTALALTNVIEARSAPGTSAFAIRNAVENGCARVQQRANGTLTASPQIIVDRFYTWISSGSSVSGAIAQVTGIQTASGFGIGIQAASWTTGGAAVRTRIEGKSTRRFDSKTVLFSCKVYHDFGSATDFGITLAKANSLDNFSGTTQIGSTGTVSCASGSYTQVYGTATLSSTDGDTGLEITLLGATNTVSNKNVYVGDFMLVESSITTEPMELLPIEMVLAQCQRRLFRMAPAAVGPKFGVGLCDASTSSRIVIQFPTQMASPPTALTQSGTASHYSVVSGAGVDTVCSAVPSFVNATVFDAEIFFTVAAGLTAGQAALARSNSTSAYLEWNCEL